MVIQVRRGNHLAERWRAKSNLAMCWLPYGAYTNDFLRTQCNAGVGEARQAGGRQGTARGVRQSKAGGDSQGNARVSRGEDARQGKARHGTGEGAKQGTGEAVRHTHTHRRTATHTYSLILHIRRKYI
jgi:hypothetical protein